MKNIIIAFTTLILIGCQNSNNVDNFVPVPEPIKPSTESIKLSPPISDDFNNSDDFKLPNEFRIDEDLISIGLDMTIVDDGKIGKITQRMVSFTTTFQLYNKNNKLIATAKESLFSWGTLINVYDENDNFIGAFKEEIFDSLFSIRTIYSILDKNKKIVATSKKLDFTSTTIDIFTNDGINVITMRRPMINILSDSWATTINNSVVDNRVICFIPAYKTYSDNERNDE